jgi:hypothetical protein
MGLANGADVDNDSGDCSDVVNRWDLLVIAVGIACGMAMVTWASDGRRNESE